MLNNTYRAVSTYIKAHKIWIIVIAIILILGAFFLYRRNTSSSNQTRYVLGTVERGTLISTVSGTGQIAAVNQIDIKPKVSGDVTGIYVKAGQTVKAGAIIARLDATDAAKALRDAQLNLASAQITYQKSLQTSQNDISSAQDALQKSYDDGFNAVTDAFSTIPSAMSDLWDIFYNANHSSYLTNSSLSSLSSSLIDSKDAAGKEFDKARTEYQKNFDDFKATSRSSDPSQLDALIDETYQTVKDLSNAEKDLQNLLNQVKALSKITNPQLTTDATTVSTALSHANDYVSSLYTAKTNRENAEKTIAQKNTTLNGTDILDVQSAKLSLAQKQSAVNDAYTTLANYTIRAPFDGVIAKVDVAPANSASSATTIATLLTHDSFATISLNEVDIAKIHEGDKATLTFDAIPDLSLTGEVAEIDSVGTVSQGVVSYNVKIKFDTQDDRIKSGMSVSASIITGSKPDVLLVPSSAVKTQNGNSYVQVLEGVSSSTSNTSAGVTSATLPQQIPVEIGDSNDSSVEIVSGLNEGDQIVTRTISATASRTTTSSGGLFNGGARTGGAVRAGGNVRIGG